MTTFKSYRFVNGKLRCIIVDEIGNIVDINPNKEELKGLEKEIQLPYSRGNKKISNICCNCKSHNTYINPIGYEKWHKCRCQKITCTTYLCESCYKKYDPNSFVNIQKSLRNCRTRNHNSNFPQAKAIKSQKLACELYGWIDLNKENDHYTSPIDCYDPNTGLYHQVQMRYYDSIERRWPFTKFEGEWKKIFEYMVCFCFSKDGKTVERIYKFPWKEIMRIKGISIYKNSTAGRYSTPVTSQFEQYRVKDEDELKKANEIWKKIIDNK